MNELYDTVIVGSGPAGLTAGIYNLRAGLKTLVISGNQPGGQLIITTMVDNYPGFPNGVGGVKLMMDMQAQFKNLGGEIKSGVVKEIKNGFEIVLENEEIIKSKAVIIATGAAIKWLGLPNEKELIGKGISGCATCDGMFFRNKTVAVIGGGDTACEEAEFLSRLANKVYLIHRRDSLRASAVEQEKVLNNPKIEMVWNTEVTELNPNNQIPRDKQDPITNTQITNKLQNIKLKNNVSGEEKILEIDGMFVAVGYKPATDFVKGLVEIDQNGHIVVNKNEQFKTMTTVEGIFAAGDCVNANHRQAIIAAGDGCRAGLDAEKWVNR